MLIVMSGLPGTGKSALARAFGREHRVPVLSVDPRP
ncbi:AAA family ATPase [Nocardiopsis aegyptia]